jgi:cytidine deaminase
LESGFRVGAAFLFTNGEIVGGANVEDQGGKTTVGACAERSALLSANAKFGPLSDRGLDNGVRWIEAGVWAPTPEPITPCGICRDAMAGTALDDARILSTCNGPSEATFLIRDLLPLAGRGINGDVSEELESWRLRGGVVTEQLSLAALSLFGMAEAAASKSYLPPFSKQPASGAALLLEDGSILTGALIIEATTRLGGGAITNAIRKAIEGRVSEVRRAVKIALYTDSEILRAPSGCDLQLLQEIRVPGEVEIVFGCRDKKFSSNLDELYKLPFGRADLGY